MKKLFILLTVMFAMFVSSCTEQQRAKKYGGSAKIELPAGKKLVTATWKENDLWFLYRERRENEQPETYEFKESSSWGVLQGTIYVIER